MNRITRLTKKCVQTGGRNNHGVTTVFHRGGGNKKLYRIIDFKRSLSNHPAIVKKIEYDPNRTSYIALVSYRNGMISYILAPKNLSVGDQIGAGPTAEIKVGSALPVSNIPIGTAVHSIELKPGRGGQLMRAAGTYAKIIKKDQNNVIIRLHSGKLYSIPSQAMATIGEVSNEAHKNRKLTKAGQAR
jgi:large subunit ribosomal protein L2